MQNLRLKIISQRHLTHNVLRLELGGGSLPPVAPGQFVQLSVPGFYLRRPISVCDSSSESISLVYKTVGEGTAALSRLHEGETLDVLMPLGHGFDCSRGKVLLLGGGLGAAPLLHSARRILRAGGEVAAVLGFNSAADIVLLDEYRALGVEPLVVTLDGSFGLKGFVTDAPLPEHSRFCTCGPLPLMRAVCKNLLTPGELSMEERMGCGAGYCYGCTIQTAGGAKRVCSDGPVFKKEEILW